jgi:putative transposase
MRFTFIAKRRRIWPTSWICDARGATRSGFHAWLMCVLSAKSHSDVKFGARSCPLHLQ